MAPPSYPDTFTQYPTRINRKRKSSFITKPRKYETTKKTMNRNSKLIPRGDSTCARRQVLLGGIFNIFVFFNFRVFVISFIFLSQNTHILQLRD